MAESDDRAAEGGGRRRGPFAGPPDDGLNLNGPGDPDDDALESLVSPAGSLVLGLLLVAIGLFSLYALIAMWPAVDAATTKGSAPVGVTLVGIDWKPSNEVALLMLVTFSSALGSSLHATISFTDYVGNRRLAKSWVWWYVLRTYVGVALSLLFYFALRGGLFSANTPTDVINPFGIGALAGLVGLFSKQATDKLREIFDTMFRTAPGKGDDQRGDSIVNPKPVVGGAIPSIIQAAGAAPVEIRLTGEGFILDSVVRVSRSREGRGPFVQRSTQFVGPTELRVWLDPEDIEKTGVAYLTVINPPPGGGRSGQAEVEIHDAQGA